MSSLVRPQFTTIDGLSVRFAEGGHADRDALLLSPWPESIYAFEPAWEQVAAHAHLVAVDPPGFGKSEYREALMNPKAVGDFIIRIADTFGLDNPHVVAPDIGTSSSCSPRPRDGTGSAPSSSAAAAPQCRSKSPAP